MRTLPLLIVGAAALILTACDDAAPRKAAKAPAKVAEADCCCKERCPMDRPAAPVVGTPEEEGIVSHKGGHVRRVSHERRGGYRYRGRSGTEGVGYLDEDSYGYRRVERSGTEGVGYLDEEAGYRGGGYRRVGGSVSVEESESYSESARYSESASGYSYSSGGGGVVVYDSGGRRIEGRGHGRRYGGGGYAGVDRDGYLTWPGKTE
jgi:hypothetical protein